MHDVTHAIAVLRDMTGLRQIDLAERGFFELVIDAISVYFVRVDDHQIELSHQLAGTDAKDSIQHMADLLFANRSERRLGAARFALDPGDQSVRLNERIDVREVEANTLEERLIGFVDTCHWVTVGDGRHVIAKPAAPAEELLDPGLFIRL